MNRQRLAQETDLVAWRPIIRALRASRAETRRTRATLKRVARQLDVEQRQHPLGLDTLTVQDGSRWFSALALISHCEAQWDPARGQALVVAVLDALNKRFVHVPSLIHEGAGRPEDYSLKAMTRMLADADVPNPAIARHLGQIPKKLFPNGTYASARKTGTTVEARRRRLRGNQSREEPDASVDLLLRGLEAHAKRADSAYAATLLYALAALGDTVNRRLKGEQTDLTEERRLATRLREAVAAVSTATKRARGPRAPRLPRSGH